MYDDYHNQFRNEKNYLNNNVIIFIYIFIQFLKIRIYYKFNLTDM